MEILNILKKNEGTRNVIKHSLDFKRILILIILANCFLINLNVSREVKSHLLKEEEFPELSDEELIRAKQQYSIEEDFDQKGYLEPLIKPEVFDLNKDRRISKEELKKTIKYCVFPKEGSKKKSITEQLKNHVNNQVDLFVDGQNFDFLNYRQFGKFISRINPEHFINFEIMNNVHMLPKDYREVSNDL